MGLIGAVIKEGKVQAELLDMNVIANNIKRCVGIAHIMIVRIAKIKKQ